MTKSFSSPEMIIWTLNEWNPYRNQINVESSKKGKGEIAGIAISLQNNPCICFKSCVLKLIDISVFPDGRDFESVWQFSDPRSLNFYKNMTI